MYFYMDHDGGKNLRELVQTALLRSLGAAPQTLLFEGGIVTLIGEASSWDGHAGFRGKVLVFGRPESSMLPALGLRRDTALPDVTGRDACPLAEGNLPFTESDAILAYQEHPLAAGLSSAIRCRPFTRFDYTDEWNNLGFGRIRTDDSIWGACGGLAPEAATQLAGIFLREATGARYSGAYLALLDTPEASVLWCARPVGPMDSTEWTIIERFICDWRSETLPCLPCLSQTPTGCRCLVTMRLDCDEDVASARSLSEWYTREAIPFSLAVKTCVELGPDDLHLLDAVLQAGGSLLSHSHTHQADWGNGFDDALADAQMSRRWFHETLPRLPPMELAVSPFHTNPPYAVQAMAGAGFTGFVSGIIHNDPEYLLGRAGVVPFSEGRIISISQQTMLHGDCYRRQNASVSAHIAAFEAQYAAEGIFGYLDHPFSARYQYDWDSEEQRLGAHQKLVAVMKARQNVWFWSQEQCFRFVKALASVRFSTAPNGTVTLTKGNLEGFTIAYRYKNNTYSEHGS
jgi:hypothetical protein